MIMEVKVILVILGPGGSGKTTLRKFLSHNGFNPIIGCTTRKKREGEKEGEDYYYITKAEYFSDNSLILKRQVGEKLYGMRRKEFEKESELKVMISSVNGIFEMEKMNFKLKICFLNIPSLELIRRMHQRGDSIKEINEKLKVDEGKFVIDKIKFPIITFTKGSVSEIAEECRLFVSS